MEYLLNQIGFDIEQDYSNKIVVFDLDGTLVNVDSIRHLVQSTKPNFDSFHRESINCPPYDSVLDILNQFAKTDMKILIVTGRQEKYRKITDFWLAYNEVKTDNLFMRPNNFSGSKQEYKERIFQVISKDKEIFAIFDDDLNLLNLWRKIINTNLVKCPELNLLTQRI